MLSNSNYYQINARIYTVPSLMIRPRHTGSLRSSQVSMMSFKWSSSKTDPQAVGEVIHISKASKTRWHLSEVVHTITLINIALEYKINSRKKSWKNAKKTTVSKNKEKKPNQNKR